MIREDKQARWRFGKASQDYGGRKAAAPVAMERSGGWCKEWAYVETTTQSLSSVPYCPALWRQQAYMQHAYTMCAYSSIHVQLEEMSFLR